MPPVILATLNARFIHTAFGLRYLWANLGELQPQAVILEFTIQDDPLRVVSDILARSPRIVGMGVYIWNRQRTLEVVAMLKALRPSVVVVLGGPEVSHGQSAPGADHVIAGEADLAFAALCRGLLAGESAASFIQARSPRIDEIVLPYNAYTDDDIRNRVIYVEASRGCPFSCEFCLSSLPGPVRRAQTERFLAEMKDLLDRGARHFKFVDRTFNLDLNTSTAILDFFLANIQGGVAGLLLHFEMIPDRFPEALRERVVRFPPGTLQFEIGIQTLNPEVARRISRRINPERISENLRFLVEHTHVHIHADLIVGLPGEDLAGLAAGFDQLLALRPHEIQVGLLKYLAGTPIHRHDAEFGMVYRQQPPYDLLESQALDFETLIHLRHFARLWDRVVNRGLFIRTGPLLWSEGSAFTRFSAFTRQVIAQTGQSHGLGRMRLTELLFHHLTGVLGQPAPAVASALVADFRRGNSRNPPRFLMEYLEGKQPEAVGRQKSWRRQDRHR